MHTSVANSPNIATSLGLKGSLAITIVSCRPSISSSFSIADMALDGLQRHVEKSAAVKGQADCLLQRWARGWGVTAASLLLVAVR